MVRNPPIRFPSPAATRTSKLSGPPEKTSRSKLRGIQPKRLNSRQIVLRRFDRFLKTNDELSAEQSTKHVPRGGIRIFTLGLDFASWTRISTNVAPGSKHVLFLNYLTMALFISISLEITMRSGASSKRSINDAFSSLCRQFRYTVCSHVGSGPYSKFLHHCAR